METIVDLVRATAARVPDHTALVMRAGVRTTRLSYRELDGRAGAYARMLRDRGVAPGDRVIIWAQNQPDWVAAMLGTYLAGAVLVPLDIRCTRDFVERVVSQVEPRLAFADRAQAQVLQTLDVATVELGHDPGAPEPGAASRAMPSDLADIIYTSGTTGDPKGVMLTHANITANTRAALQVIPLSDTTRMVSLLPLSHMFEQVGGCLGPLAVGGQVAYPTSRQPVSLMRTMAEFQPTALILVPQALRLFTNAIEREAAQSGKSGRLDRMRAVAARLPAPIRRMLFRPVLGRFGGHLEFIAVGGAALDPALAASWEVMGVPVLEGYGTTECSPILAITPLNDRRPGSCGRGLVGQDLRIASDGEVLARGPHVFAGYWRNEAATAAVLTEGWYHTGDLGLIDDDGYLRLKGRKKDLIVLSDGQNVYPEDVERELTREPGIQDAVVLAANVAGTTRLHAIVLEATPGAAEPAVRGANARLDSRQQILGVSTWPDDDFPRTHTLKVRRGVVEEWLNRQAPVSRQAPAVDPTDALAVLLASLSRTDATITEGLELGTDLGLDSLGRVELLSAIEEEIGAYVDDTEVDGQTTVGALRALVTRGARPPRAHRFPRWPRSRMASATRATLMPTLFLPLLRLGYRVEVRGRENLQAAAPCLVASNHNMHLDQSLLLLTMPGGFRRRLAIAAAASDIFGNRIRGFISAWLGNAFPFAKEGSGVRDSLEHVARLLDDGWSVLIFPEGKLTVMGPTQPFKSGTGLLAVETGVPVVPARIDVIRPGFREGRWLPHPRARVRINYGSPVRFPPGMDFGAATAALEAAVQRA